MRQTPLTKLSVGRKLPRKSLKRMILKDDSKKDKASSGTTTETDKKTTGSRPYTVVNEGWSWVTKSSN